MNGYHETEAEICNHLQTNSKLGLSSQEAHERLSLYGYNEIKTNKSPSIILIFLSQFTDPLIYILLLAAGVIFFIGQSLDAYIITGILLFNSIIGTIQEYRTYNILNSLQLFLKAESIVIRDKEQHIIENKYLVPGDIIYIKAGEKIPADARILEEYNLTLDESVLTGESQAVGKVAHPTKHDNIAIHDQINMVFQGTYVLSGHATAVVIKTGKYTQVGKLHKDIESIDTNTPLKKELEKLSYAILIFVLTLCTLLFVIGILTGKTFADLLVMLTALFICVIPEGLPVVMTLVLATGAYRMAKKNILVKKLPIIEALGRVNVVITDKTGTLTRNEMMVVKAIVNNSILSVSGKGYCQIGDIENKEAHTPVLEKLATACMLLNDTIIEQNEITKLFKIKGDPTEAATYVFGKKVSKDIDAYAKTYTVDYNIPFDSSSRYKATFCTKENRHIAFVMGAPETILSRCNNISETMQSHLQQFLNQGFRVVAIAEKEFNFIKQKNLSHYQSILTHDLSCLGLLVMHDATRDNLKPIISQALQANIKILMATGDHQSTALNIAQHVGLAEEGDTVLLGEKFEKLDDQKAIQALKQTSVCARFSPQNKLRLVHLFHHQHKIVAMTGDGVNDVPALIAADIGISMGNIGTDLSKQASDVILLQDSFDSLLYAIKQGRNIFHALRRTILYFLTSNMGEVLVVFFALALNLPFPILAAQILWLNLITDGFLDVALAMETETNSVLTKLETDHPLTIFSIDIIYKMFFLSIPMGIAGIYTFLQYYQTDIELARTLTLLTLAMFQWFNAWNCRSEDKSVFEIGIFSNFWIILATITVLILQVMVIYVPFMQQIFRTVPLQLNHWIYALCLSSSIFILEEIRKYIFKIHRNNQ